MAIDLYPLTGIELLIENTRKKSIAIIHYRKRDEQKRLLLFDTVLLHAILMSYSLKAVLKAI